MSKLPESLAQVDWEVTTWEGSRREQLRRWAALPLDRVIAALEEMGELGDGGFRPPLDQVRRPNAHCPAERVMAELPNKPVERQSSGDVQSGPEDEA